MHIDTLIQKLSNVKGNGTAYTTRCPAHNDRHNSLSVGVGEDGRILLHCHAGCHTAAVLDALGLKMADLFPEKQFLRPKKGKQQPGTRGLSTSGTREVENLVSTEEAQRTGSTADPHGNASMIQMCARGETHLQICKKASIHYAYHTAEGALLFETVRQQSTDGSKSFRQRQPNGKGGWLYSLSGITPVLYRLPQVLESARSGGAVYVCEGEKDADALAALGLCATTAPMGAGKWRDGYTDALRGAGMVYVLPDNDRPGRAHALLVAGALAAQDIPVRVVDLPALWPQLPAKGDVSDALDALGSAALLEGLEHCALSAAAFEPLAVRRDAEDAAPAYTFEPVTGYLQTDFLRAVQKNAAAPRLRTGFARLDEQLGGGLYAGLYVVGSVSSLGKSAFCQQMAEALAGQGTDVLFFTLEMSRLEMTGRGVVRRLFCDGGFNPEYSLGQLLHGNIPQVALQAAVQRYEKAYGQHLAFIEGEFAMTVADVARQAAAHLRTTGRRPVIFVDYLQILRPPDVRMSDKQAMDHNVIELKRLSRELDIPVVAVSSFNRQSYTEQVNFAAFKESGAIEYSADFVLGLQARGVGQGSDALLDEKKAARMVAGETKKAKQQDPRPLEAVTLKNRRGPAWASFDVDFYARQNHFVEVGRFSGAPAPGESKA